MLKYERISKNGIEMNVKHNKDVLNNAYYNEHYNNARITQVCSAFLIMM